MKKIIFFLILAVICIMIYFQFFRTSKILSPLGTGKISQEKTLAQYSYLALSKTTFVGSDIKIDKTLKNGNGFTSYLFYYTVRGKKVSGLLNVPAEAGDYPVIVLIRGYVDPSVYTIGEGTAHDGEYLAQQGFITLAPDFLGYGLSDKDSTDPMEGRFLTYVTTAELFSSIKNLNIALEKKLLSVRYDGKNIGLWGHSNGGQIALSTLEITGKDYPTVLWAPVSKPFPYSILYYTDEADDHGKSLIKLVADFESHYDAEKYSPTNYFDWIKAPLQIHQGGSDEEVPQKWSDNLVVILKQKKKEIEYFTYPTEDHNFTKGDWSTAIKRTADFYREKFKN